MKGMTLLDCCALSRQDGAVRGHSSRLPPYTLCPSTAMPSDELLMHARRLLWKQAKGEQLRLWAKMVSVSPFGTENMVQKLSSVPAPEQVNVFVIDLSGATYSIPVQTQYIASIGASGELTTCVATVADVKCIIAQHCSVPAGSQILSVCEHDSVLEDDEEMQHLGLAEGQQLCMIVDHDMPYWKQHRMLVFKFGHVVAKVHKTMKHLKSELKRLSRTANRRRVSVMLSSCCKAAQFLLEKSSTHKARSMRYLKKVETHLQTVVLPCAQHIMSRECDALRRNLETVTRLRSELR